MKLTMTLQTMDAMTGGDRVSRNMGNINPNYVTYTGATEEAAHLLPFNSDGAQYNSFMEWAQAVGRGLASLSKGSFDEAIINATWGVTEED